MRGIRSWSCNDGKNKLSFTFHAPTRTMTISKGGIYRYFVVQFTNNIWLTDDYYPQVCSVISEIASKAPANICCMIEIPAEGEKCQIMLSEVTQRGGMQ